MILLKVPQLPHLCFHAGVLRKDLVAPDDLNIEHEVVARCHKRSNAVLLLLKAVLKSLQGCRCEREPNPVFAACRNPLVLGHTFRDRPAAGTGAWSGGDLLCPSHFDGGLVREGNMKVRV